MMLVSSVALIISVFLQGLMSRYLGYTYTNLSIFSTVFVLITLLIIIPYFSNKKKYFLLVLIFGIIMDIVYTDVFLLNVSLFVVAYYLSKSFHFFFPYNWLTVSVSNILCVFMYHIVSFLFLTILGYDSYSFFALLKILGCSVISTFVYSSIVHVIIEFIYNKLQLKEVK